MDFRFLKDPIEANGLTTHSGKRRFEVGSYYRYFDTSSSRFI